MRAQTPQTGASGAPTVGDLLARSTRGQVESDRKRTFHEKVERDRRKRAALYFNNPGPWEFLFSEAGRAVTKTQPAAIVVYLHIVARQSLPPRKKERARLEKLGMWPPKETKAFSFPVEEGPIHGLTRKKTATGLRILHEFGAIDRTHPGSATRGDFATYMLSERWRKWQQPDGGPDFLVLDWIKAVVIGARDGNTGQFLKRKRTPKTSRKIRVVAKTTTSKPSLVAKTTTREKRLVVDSAMNKPPEADALVVDSAISLVLPVLDSDPKPVKERSEPKSPPFRSDENPFWAEDEALFHSFESEATH